MRRKRRYLPMSEQLGFTLVEMLMVIAIMGVLASMAIGEFVNRRKEAYNKSAQSFTRNLLTMVDSAFANEEVPTAWGPTSGGAGPAGFDDFKMNADMKCYVFYDNANDVWQYYLTSVSGTTAYYFWVPGPDCKLAVDASGLRSDTIYDNRDPDVLAKTGGWDWRTDGSIFNLPS